METTEPNRRWLRIVRAKLAPFGYLRFAISILILGVCVVLIVLWLQSYDRSSSISLRREGWSAGVASFKGELIVRFFFKPPTRYEFDIPYSLVVLLASTLVVVPWIKWSPRFRLRTLLIAATVIAVLCGIVAMSN